MVFFESLSQSVEILCCVHVDRGLPVDDPCFSTEKLKNLLELPVCYAGKDDVDWKNCFKVSVLSVIEQLLPMPSLKQKGLGLTKLNTECLVALRSRTKDGTNRPRWSPSETVP